MTNPNGQRPKRKANRQTRYTDDFRATAVLVLEAAGWHPDPAKRKKGALANASRSVGVHANTLRRWGLAMQNPAPNQLVEQKRTTMVEAMTNLAFNLLDDMDDARRDAGLRDLATAFGIVKDKLALDTGNPTANENHRILIGYADSD